MRRAPPLPPASPRPETAHWPCACVPGGPSPRTAPPLTPLLSLEGAGGGLHVAKSLGPRGQGVPPPVSGFSGWASPRPNPRPALPPPPQAERPWPVRRPWAASPSGAGAWASCRSSRPSSRGTVSVPGCWGAVCRLEDLPGLRESGRAQGGFKGSPAPCPASGLRGGWGRWCAGPGCWLARAGHPHLGPFPPQSPAHTRSSR